ncbi:MAG: cephalosporin hydroxylase family protein [Proteobacteria bacterium]|nr:cephalosporin hydroxylase family protein [Pseudomonadota bacterium]MBU1596124.1 cephalosporin hydroxylase family protein [Pseudomonadota bacterium]
MKLTLEAHGQTRTVDVFSQEGLEMVSSLWVKLYAQYKLTHNCTWMGVPIIQFPEDIMMMEELIWKVRPDVIVECGFAHGGSALFYGSLMELMGKGIVVGVDVEIRPYNRIAVQNHPMGHRVRMVEGSSIEADTIRQVKSFIRPGDKVVVLLDSNHSKEHVAREIELYREFVSPGSYLVVMDGAQAFVWDMPDGKQEWKDDNPLAAIEDFMASAKGQDEFEIDEHFTRLFVTSNPKAYLRRKTGR